MTASPLPCQFNQIARPGVDTGASNIFNLSSDHLHLSFCRDKKALEEKAAKKAAQAAAAGGGGGGGGASQSNKGNATSKK